MKKLTPIKTQQQILQSEPDLAEIPQESFGDYLSLDDIVNQIASTMALAAEGAG